MPEIHFELTVGETLQVGDQLLTIVDIEDGEITVRLDPGDAEEFGGNAQINLPPR